LVQAELTQLRDSHNVALARITQLEAEVADRFKGSPPSAEGRRGTCYKPRDSTSQGRRAAWQGRSQQARPSSAPRLSRSRARSGACAEESATKKDPSAYPRSLLGVCPPADRPPRWLRGHLQSLPDLRPSGGDGRVLGGSQQLRPQVHQQACVGGGRLGPQGYDAERGD
jgi:hypothetical protein